MIIPDANLLIRAHKSGSRHRETARPWCEALVNGARTVGLPWAPVLGDPEVGDIRARRLTAGQASR